MSRYTDLMKKKELSDQEKDELFELVQEEFDREERRLSKLPIDEYTRQECLWNVVNAHRNLLDEKFADYHPDGKVITDYLDLDLKTADCKKRLYGAYRGLKNWEQEMEEKNWQEQPNADVEDEFIEEIANAAYQGNEGLNNHEVHDQAMIADFDADVTVTEEHKHLLNEKEKEDVNWKNYGTAGREMSMQKCPYPYSIEGDKTITTEQKKALYQFHHWMRKHNATAPIKWAGFGYKGSAVDFSERFMRLPARVQLKALYLVETDQRKNPNEDVDNALSQDDSYVPNYDKLKKKMTSNFLFVRKYLNGSRYLWDKLEQATNLANDEKSVESLKNYSDAKKAGMDAEERAISTAEFFIKPEDDFALFKLVQRYAGSQKRMAEDPEQSSDSREAAKENYKNAQTALKHYGVLMKHFAILAQLPVDYGAELGGQNLDKKTRKDMETSFKAINKTLSELRNDKLKSCLKDYKHYFFNQTNDLAGYTAISSGVGQGIYALHTGNSASDYLNGGVNLALAPAALMNCINSVRKMFYGEGGAEKALGGAETAANLMMLGSRGINISKMFTKIGDTLSNHAGYLACASMGIGLVINSGKAVNSLWKNRKANRLKADFDSLKAELEKKMNATNDIETIQKLERMKKRTAWSTLEKASKLIQNDKIRERNSNIRKWIGSVIGCASAGIGYIKNVIVNSIGLAGSPTSAIVGVVDASLDNLAARDRNREYIDAEYPITNAQRMVAIKHYEKRLEKCRPDSEERKEIESILSSREKLDNRIRNMNAGNRFHAHQEGLRDEISKSYTNILAKEGATGKQNPADIVEEYENRARELMAGFASLLGAKKPEEKAAENEAPLRDSKLDQDDGIKRSNTVVSEKPEEKDNSTDLKRANTLPVFAK